MRIQRAFSGAFQEAPDLHSGQYRAHSGHCKGAFGCFETSVEEHTAFLVVLNHHTRRRRFSRTGLLSNWKSQEIQLGIRIIRPSRWYLNSELGTNERRYSTEGPAARLALPQGTCVCVGLCSLPARWRVAGAWSVISKPGGGNEFGTRTLTRNLLRGLA